MLDFMAGIETGAHGSVHVVVGGEYPTFGFFESLRAKGINESLVSDFERSKAGLLPLQILNLSDKISGNEIV